MLNSSLLAKGTLLVASALLVGCGPKPTIDQIKAEMCKERPRPAELDQLDTLVGTWENSGEMTFPGIEGSIAFSGTSTSTWDMDRRVVNERMTGQMGGSTMTGINLMWWDDREKEFHTFWVDSMGMTMQAEGRYDAANKTWTMESSGTDPHSGSPTKGIGTMKMTDGNTMEWCHTEKNMWGMTIMEMKGTSRRKG